MLIAASMLVTLSCPAMVITEEREGRVTWCPLAAELDDVYLNSVLMT